MALDKKRPSIICPPRGGQGDRLHILKNFLSAEDAREDARHGQGTLSQTRLPVKFHRVRPLSLSFVILTIVGTVASTIRHISLSCHFVSYHVAITVEHPLALSLYRYQCVTLPGAGISHCLSPLLSRHSAPISAVCSEVLTDRTYWTTS
jgi:hypothetical protein